MAKCSAQLKEYISNNVSWFEAGVVAVCRQNLDFFNKVKPVLCRKPGKKEKHTDDFEVAINNVVYAAVRDYNTMFDEARSREFFPIQEDWLTNWLIMQSNKGEYVSLSEIPGVIQYFKEQIVPCEVNSSLQFLITTAISDYLRGIRGKKIVNTASMSGTSIDDLAFLIDGDMKMLSCLDDGDRLVSHLPDQMSFKNLPMWDDPNKVLYETLECDIPLLNSVLGNFLKGGAYMFIGTTGSGKTICACQLASAFSYSGGACGLYISTEQSYDQLVPRIVANRCSIPHDVIKGGIIKDKLSPREQTSYIDFKRKAAELQSGDIHFVNWGNKEKVAGFNVSREIERAIDDYEEENGRKISYVILDWIGGALGAMADAKDGPRLIYQDAADSLERLARKRNIVACAFAQAVPGALNKLHISWADLAECKTMARNYTGIIGITTLYSETFLKHIHESENKKRKDFRVSPDMDDADMFATKQFLHVSKSRMGPPKNVPFYRAYELQRMQAWT